MSRNTISLSSAIKAGSELVSKDVQKSYFKAAANQALEFADILGLADIGVQGPAGIARVTEDLKYNDIGTLSKRVTRRLLDAWPDLGKRVRMIPKLNRVVERKYGAGYTEKTLFGLLTYLFDRKNVSRGELIGVLEQAGL